jgi:Cu(I)/Ag(I) efflux system protein CusF
MKSLWIPLLVTMMVVSAGVIWADDMKGMPMGDKMSAKTHHAVGTVKKLDTQKGSVTIAHGAVKTLNWPAMTMTFGVKDKALLDKLAQGNKVEVDFVEDGSDYTIVTVK